MNFHVFVQVCFLCESLLTVIVRAYKGSFSCMYPKMIEEVVPLSEVHFASLVIAFEDFYESVCSRVLILKHLEIFGLWNRFLNLKLLKIIIFALCYLYINTLWDLSFYFIIRNKLVTHDFRPD